MILLIHSTNISSGLICTGIFEDDINGTYEIPPGWNKSIAGVYSLRYSNKNDIPIYFKLIDANKYSLSINCLCLDSIS